MSSTESWYSWQPFEDGECCVCVVHTQSALSPDFSKYVNLPCYPEEISNTVEALWATQTILGRTGTINAFTGTSDISTNFSFDLHKEMIIPASNKEGRNNDSNKEGRNNDVENINELIAYIKSGCYPSYGSSILSPPYVLWKFGQTIITGRLKSVSDVWKKPIINQEYAVCTLSISMESATIGIADAESVRGIGSPYMQNASSTFSTRLKNAT